MSAQDTALPTYKTLNKPPIPNTAGRAIPRVQPRSHVRPAWVVSIASIASDTDSLSPYLGAKRHHANRTQQVREDMKWEKIAEKIRRQRLARFQRPYRNPFLGAPRRGHEGRELSRVVSTIEPHENNSIKANSTNANSIKANSTNANSIKANSTNANSNFKTISTGNIARIEEDQGWDMFHLTPEVKARLCSLAILLILALYIMIGAMVFMGLEAGSTSPAAFNKSSQEAGSNVTSNVSNTTTKESNYNVTYNSSVTTTPTNTTLRYTSLLHNVSTSTLVTMLPLYRSQCRAPVKQSNTTLTYWRCVEALTAVFTTLGYRDTAPTTWLGRMFLLIYTVPGLLLTLCFLSSLSSFLLAILNNALKCAVSRNERCLHRAECTVVAVISGLILFAVVSGMSLHLYLTDYWFSLVATFYYYTTTLTTIGPGDISLAGDSPLVLVRVGLVYLLGLSMVAMVVRAVVACVYACRCDEEAQYEEVKKVSVVRSMRGARDYGIDRIDDIPE